MVFRTKDVKRYQLCPKAFLMSTKNKEKNFPFIYFNESLINAACRYLNINMENAYFGQPNESSQDTLLGFQDKTWLVKGRFQAHNFRTKINFLKREADGLVYYVLCRTNFPKEDEVRRIFMDKWLLELSGLNIKHVCLVHLNAQYVFQEQLDYQALFLVSERFFKEANKLGKNVDDVLANYDYDMLSALKNMQEIVELDVVDIPFHLECTKHGKCDYYQHCFNENELSDNSILFINGTRRKYEMLMSGKKYMNDLSFDDDVDGTYIQWAQYMSAITKQDFVDYNALSYWMETYFKKPYTFIDFEWDTIGIPMYNNMKPYDVLLFQYSIDIEDENGHLTHKQYLGDGGDTREEFIKNLLKDIPPTGSIIAYHAEGAEILRLKELALQFPIYEEALLSICERTLDLTYPIMQGMIYMPKLRGTLSLKRILEVIEPENSYNNLDIKHGLKAVEAYRNLKSLDEEEAAKIKEELFNYCGLDTYAMVAFTRYLTTKIVNKS